MIAPRPASLLSAYSRDPSRARLFRAVDQARQSRRPDDPAWPPEVFLPLEAAGRIVLERGRAAGQSVQSPGDLVRPAAELQVFAAWRMTKGIYRFDPDLAAALMATEITGDIPAEPLARLPEWCVYVETPGLDTPLLGGGTTPVHGVFALLDGTAQGARLLTMALDTDAQLAMTHLALGLPLAESLARREAQWRENCRRGIATEWHAGAEAAAAALLTKVLGLLLYLCSEAPEIDGSGHPGNPAPKRTKEGWRLFAADQSRTWDVGVRIGAALRLAREEPRSGEPGGGSHAGPRPHLRRAHWHTYRVGKGRTEAVLRWLPPIPVNLEAGEALPAVVHPVKP
jgi:hypothetical protein